MVANLSLFLQLPAFVLGSPTDGTKEKKSVEGGRKPAVLSQSATQAMGRPII